VDDKESISMPTSVSNHSIIVQLTNGRSFHLTLEHLLSRLMFMKDRRARDESN
jgi:hypothetical protein